METNQILTSVIIPPVPVMEAGRFTDLVGVSADVVRGWIDKGHIPTMKVGRYRLVNVAAMAREALQSEV